jgi:hypothetical protein
MVSGVSEFAIDYQLIPSNPCAVVMKRLGMPHRLYRKPVVVFSKDDVIPILET